MESPLVFFVLSAVFAGAMAKEQSVGVHGVLMCGKFPLTHTKVKLWNKEFAHHEKELASTTTDEFGRFEVSGSTHEFLTLDPRIKIYHNCEDGGITDHEACQRKVKLTIPKEHVNKGDIVTNWFDVGVLNMQRKFKDEERSCSNTD